MSSLSNRSTVRQLILDRYYILSHFEIVVFPQECLQSGIKLSQQVFILFLNMFIQYITMYTSFCTDKTESEVSVLFLGRESAGKTTIREWVERGLLFHILFVIFSATFLGKVPKEPPKTIGIEYSFSKKSVNPTQPDRIINFYEVGIAYTFLPHMAVTFSLGGGHHFASFIDVTIQPPSLLRSTFIITVDLSRVCSLSI